MIIICHASCTHGSGLHHNVRHATHKVRHTAEGSASLRRIVSPVSCIAVLLHRSAAGMPLMPVSCIAVLLVSQPQLPLCLTPWYCGRYDYAMPLFVVGFVCTWIGQKVVDHLVKKYNNRCRFQIQHLPYHLLCLQFLYHLFHCISYNPQLHSYGIPGYHLNIYQLGQRHWAWCM